MNAWFKPLAIGGFCALVLSGCSLFTTEDELVVAELVEFDPQFKGKRVWDASIGDGVSHHASRLRPAVANDKVFAASREGVVKALAQATGKTIWQVHLGEKNSGWFSGRQSAMISGGVTVSENQLYLGTERGLVFCLDAETGKLILTNLN